MGLSSALPSPNHSWGRGLPGWTGPVPGLGGRSALGAKFSMVPVPNGVCGPELSSWSRNPQGRLGGSISGLLPERRQLRERLLRAFPLAGGLPRPFSLERLGEGDAQRTSRDRRAGRSSPLLYSRVSAGCSTPPSPLPSLPGPCRRCESLNPSLPTRKPSCSPPRASTAYYWGHPPRSRAEGGAEFSLHEGRSVVLPPSGTRAQFSGPTSFPTFPFQVSTFWSLWRKWFRSPLCPALAHLRA